MKQIKFLMMALIMGVVMTSCLDSDDSSTSQNAAIGKLVGSYGSMYLTTTDGYKIYFSYESISTALANGIDLNNYVGQVLYCVYDTSSAVLDEANKSLSDAAILQFSSLSNPTGVVYTDVPTEPWNVDAATDSIGNAAIIELSDNVYEKPSFPFSSDSYTLFLPVNYNILYSGSSVYYHSLSLIYYPEEVTEEGTLNLYLRYHTTAPEGSEMIKSSSTYNPYYMYKYYDLREVFSAYRAQNGTSPTKVVIKYYSNSYNTEIKDSQSSEQSYTVSVSEASY